VTVQLTSDDFRKLVDLIAQDPNFRSVRDRARLLSGALEGSPRAEDILSTLDLDGTPRGVAVDVVQRLSHFGRVTADKEALGVFLNYLLFFKGEGDVEAAFIRGLIEAYRLDRPVVPEGDMSRWRGAETPAAVEEKIIGEDTLRHVRILALGQDAARAVVHISVAGGRGSGFMVSPDLLMTNHHVIPDHPAALAGSYAFFYELGRDGRQKEAQTVAADPKGRFHTNEALDYTVVQLADVPAFGEPLQLAAAVLPRDARVTIIQHPGGHYKKISLQNNFVVYADQRVVQYTTSTMPGSSGSPVFDDDFRVVAIHHSGGMIVEPATQRRYLRNEGISMVSILRDVQSRAPDIFAGLG
jgi:V8-like Glu-specific endopeptidase